MAVGLVCGWCRDIRRRVLDGLDAAARCALVDGAQPAAWAWRWDEVGFVVLSSHV